MQLTVFQYREISSTLPQRHNGGWFHNVSVFDIRKTLRKHGQRTSTCKKSAIVSSGSRQYRNHVYNRQTVRRYKNILLQKAAKGIGRRSATRTILTVAEAIFG